MTGALLLALMVACNSGGSQSSESAATDLKASAPNLDKRKDTHSVLEIPRPRLHARHILLAYADAPGAGDKVERNQSDAQSLARKVLAELNAGGDFEALAKQYSDDGSGNRGGDLGVFTKGVMHKDFEAATLDLDIGGRSSVIETPFGFHIIERLPVIEAHLAHILIQWEGLKRTRSERTREEATERAEQVISLLNNGADFGALAIEWSDGPFGKRGGDLGWFQRGQMVPQFDDTAFALSKGEISGIVESIHGFHVIRRLE
jgi:peptidyl-prolyl cis-trans isomerase SurA